MPRARQREAGRDQDDWDHGRDRATGSSTAMAASASAPDKAPRWKPHRHTGILRGTRRLHRADHRLIPSVSYAHHKCTIFRSRWEPRGVRGM